MQNIKFPVFQGKRPTEGNKFPPAFLKEALTLDTIDIYIST